MILARLSFFPIRVPKMHEVLASPIPRFSDGLRGCASDTVVPVLVTGAGGCIIRSRCGYRLGEVVCSLSHWAFSLSVSTVCGGITAISRAVFFPVSKTPMPSTSKIVPTIP